MSKLYEKYKVLKENNPEQLYLFKVGVFYIFLDEDAKMVSDALGLKCTHLNENIMKSGIFRKIFAFICDEGLENRNYGSPIY